MGGKDNKTTPKRRKHSLNSTSSEDQQVSAKKLRSSAPNGDEQRSPLANDSNDEISTHEIIGPKDTSSPVRRVKLHGKNSHKAKNNNATASKPPESSQDEEHSSTDLSKEHDCVEVTVHAPEDEFQDDSSSDDGECDSEDEQNESFFDNGSGSDDDGEVVLSQTPQTTHDFMELQKQMHDNPAFYNMVDSMVDRKVDRKLKELDQAQARVKIDSYEKVWFVGDNFGFNTYTRHFATRVDPSFKPYTKENFEVSYFMNNKFSLDCNVVSQLRNQVNKAVYEQPLLPKMIVIIPDDDIASYFNNIEKGVEKHMARITDGISKEIDRVLDSHREFLPTRAKKPGYPAVIWNEQDPALYLKREGRFTAQGLNAYWEAIDKTVKFANTILLKKPKGQTRKHQSVVKPQDRKNPSQQYAGNSAKSGDFDRYHWTK